MNRLIGIFIALGLALWAQRILTGPQPGIARDALLLFVLAGAIFAWNAQRPQPLRRASAWLARPWPRRGRLLSLAGLGVGIVSLALLWFNLQSLPGLLLWPVAVVLFVAGTALEGRGAEIRDQRSEVRGAEGQKAEVERADEQKAEGRDWVKEDAPADTRHASRITLYAWFTAHWDLVLLAFVLAVSAFVRFYQLDVFPNGCQSDECNNGLDALRWLAGAGYMPYAETNEGQATLFTYLIALSFQLFGVGVTQMRMVSALMGLLTVVAFYFLARDLYGRHAALVGAALFATARWHVTFSRIVYELIMQPLVMVLLALFLLRALRSGQRWQWALAGVMLALGMNTYTAFRVVPFIVAAFFAFWILRELLIRWSSRRSAAVHLHCAQAQVSRPSGARPATGLRHDLQGIAIFAGAAFTAILPLGVYIVQNWNVFTGRMRHISILNDVERLGSVQPIVDNFKKTLYMFNWTGDEAALNNLPGAPMLDTLVGVLFVLGLAYALWHALRGRSVPVLYVLWFLGILSLGVLSVAHEAPTARRTIGIVPLAYLFVALVADQLFRAWHIAWRGAGRRVLYGATAVVVAAVMIANARVYFQTQALHPAVWAAYSPNESAVGRFLATLPPDATVLVTPQYEHHSAVKLIGRDHPYRALNPVDDVPYRGPTGGGQDLVYVLEPVDRPLLGLLQQIYPAGQSEQHLDRYGQNLFLSYRVPGADLAATQGLLGQFFSAYPPTRAPEAVQQTAALDIDLAQAPLPAPFFAIWEGTLLVPEYGQYSFDLLAEAGAASVKIGRQHRLDLDDAGQGRLDATLAAGFHSIRVEAQSGDAPGRLRLTWSGPTFGPTTVGGAALYTFQLGDQGLVGYYFPNANWQGPPVLVRNDLLITPNNPLRAPFSILWRGKLAAPTSGLYVIGTRSDDGSFVFIDGQMVVDNGGSHGAQDRSGQITLEQGFHDIEVRYNELGGSREMQLWWQPPGQGRAIIDSAYLFPLEGDEIPAGLTLPPPPQIALAPVVEEDVAGPGVPRPLSDDAPVAQPAGDFTSLPAALLWSFGAACGPGLDQLNNPRGVAIDPASGDVFVADTGNSRIVRLSADGQFLAAWGAAGEGPDQFMEVVDLVVEPDGRVLALDAVNQRLLRFTPDGQFVATFGAEWTFYRPRGLGIDAAGQIVVADTGGVRIVLLDPAGGLQGQIGGPESNVARQQPTDAALAPGGELYFVEAENGAVTRRAVDGGLSRWSGPAPASTIEGPHLALLPAGGLAVSDPEGRRVLLFDAVGRPLGQFGVDAGLVKPVGIAAAPGPDGVTRVAVVDSQRCQVVMFEVAAQ
jgi:4-amino-4-deoxy-L-arabinose transferase-like glycosyltransferase